MSASPVSDKAPNSLAWYVRLLLVVVGAGLLAMSGVATAYLVNQEKAPSALDEHADVLYPHSDLKRQQEAEEEEAVHLNGTAPNGVNAIITLEPE